MNHSNLDSVISINGEEQKIQKIKPVTGNQPCKLKQFVKPTITTLTRKINKIETNHLNFG